MGDDTNRYTIGYLYFKYPVANGLAGVASWARPCIRSTGTPRTTPNGDPLLDLEKGGTCRDWLQKKEMKNKTNFCCRVGLIYV